jgi:hypothetical protein
MLDGFVDLGNGRYLNLKTCPFVRVVGGGEKVHAMHADLSERIYVDAEARAIAAAIDPEAYGTPEDREYRVFLGRGGTLTREDWDRKHAYLRAVVEMLARADPDSDAWRRAQGFASDLEEELQL